MASGKGGNFIDLIKTSLLILLIAFLATFTSANAQSGGFSISGKVANSGGTGVEGVAISVSSGFVVYTDASGNYTVSMLSAGSYVLTASKAGYTFTPITHDVTVSGNVSGQNFTAKTIGAFTSCAAVAGIPTSECEALVALYDSLDGNNWYRKEGWKQTDAPCAWDGVSCAGGHVTGLDLGWNRLKGSLPSQLGNLPRLEYLYLYNNQLSGSIPAEIGNLTNLTDLGLSDNQLSGSVPSEIGNLTKLNWLSFSSNPLSGSLPLSLMQLKDLMGIWYRQTSLCAPGAVTGFQDWLKTISVYGTGITCGGYTIDVNGNGGLQEDQQFPTSPSVLTVNFTKDVRNDAGEHSVLSLQNWMLVKPGENNIFDMVITSPSICSHGHTPSGDDINIPIGAIEYDQNTHIASLLIDTAYLPLAASQYRMCACKGCQIARGKRERLDINSCQRPLSQTQRALAVKMAPSRFH